MLSRGVAAAFKLLGEVKPGAVVGFGGYPTFPPLVAASLRRHPDRCCTSRTPCSAAPTACWRSASRPSPPRSRAPSSSTARRSPTARLTGNPVRDVGDRLGRRRAIARPAATGRFSLLVFGGSQGARFFSDAVPPALALLPMQIARRLYVVQQCREEDLGRVEAAYQASRHRAQLAHFLRQSA